MFEMHAWICIPIGIVCHFYHSPFNSATALFAKRLTAPQRRFLCLGTTIACGASALKSQTHVHSQRKLLFIAQALKHWSVLELQRHRRFIVTEAILTTFCTHYHAVGMAHTHSTILLSTMPSKNINKRKAFYVSTNTQCFMSQIGSAL